MAETYLKLWCIKGSWNIKVPRICFYAASSLLTWLHHLHQGTDGAKWLMGTLHLAFGLKGWCAWHKTWLKMMMLGPLSRVMTVRQPFCEKNMQNSHFLCATFSLPARFHIFNWPERYWDPTEPHNSLTPPQVFRNYATTGLQKLYHRSSSETMAPHAGFTEPCGAIVSQHLQWC